MSLNNTDEIDAIGLDKATDDVYLTVKDDLDWKDEICHINKLQEKLNTYLRFIESGEVYDVYPEAKGKNFVIEILSKFNVPASGKDFLSKAGPVISEAGFKLIHEVFPG